MHSHTVFARSIAVAALFIVGAVAIGAIAVSYIGKTAPLQDSAGLTRIGVGGVSVLVRIASTTAQQEQGLSGTAPLPANQGMLFLFDRPGYYSMWMKDMRYPLDMLWVSDEEIIVGMERNVSPDSYPQTYVSSVPASSVVELPAGFIDAHHVRIGQRVTIF